MQQFNTNIIGGDITRSEVKTVAITAMGEVTAQQVITRSNARVGDVILISGYHGLSRAGLELLLHRDLITTLTPQEKIFLIEAHQKPQPRFDVISQLRNIAPDAVVAGMDSSDGLADAIAQICRCSNLGAVIDMGAIPRHSGLQKLATDFPIEQWILDGGEDFELVLCLAPQLARELLSRLTEKAAIIGQVIPESIIRVEGSSTLKEREVFDLRSGFQHFTSQ